MFQRRPLGELLVDARIVTPEHVSKALAMQGDKGTRAGGRIGEVLIGLKLCTPVDVARALSQQLRLEFVDTLDGDSVDPSLVSVLSISYAKQHQILPLERRDGILRVAVADPLDTFVVDDLQTLFRAEVEPVVSTADAILAAVNKVFDRRAAADAVVEELAESDPEKAAFDLEEIEDIVDSDDEAPIIRLVNSVLNQAVKEHASDIHIEPFEKHVSIRFRKDGVLHEIVRAPKRFQASITSRVKIMGDLNIAEKRMPQDGRIRIKVAGRDIDIRLSTVPTSHGERLVLRLLDKTNTVLDLTVLGMSSEHHETFESLIHRPHGIILVTGPTGSGKTTTLYAALVAINSPDKNILTIEDPVEYQIEGIGQMQVNAKIHFTFAAGLRATLRQDPDVVLVGEIRDRETAEIAVQASLTGHLVFSTLHTNDSASTFSRLIDMGVEPFLIASSILASLAQRLVRRVCKHCREPYEPPDLEIGQLNLNIDDPRTKAILAKYAPHGKKPIFYRARGCAECGQTGYSGRAAIYELLLVNDEVRLLITQRVEASVLKAAARRNGMRTLIEDGALKVLDGVTTVSELLRVAQATDEVF